MPADLTACEKNIGECRIPTKPFSPNGLKRGWHNIPLNPLSPNGLKRKRQAV